MCAVVSTNYRVEGASAQGLGVLRLRVCGLGFRVCWFRQGSGFLGLRGFGLRFPGLGFRAASGFLGLRV